MRIVTNKGELELPDSLTLEITERNPFTQEVGSMSLPVNLPPSDHNLKALGHPQRLNARGKLTTRLQATIQEGVVRLSGDLLVLSNAITSSFYLANGELYSRIKDALLTDVDYGEPRRPFTGKDLTDINKQWLTHFLNIIKGTETADYAIFPVVTQVDSTPVEDGSLKLYHARLLNQPVSSLPITGVPRDFIARKTQVDAEGNTLPVGYGVTPFLYVRVVLRYLFRHFGYSLNEDPFALHPQLNKAVVLNNTADTILGGFLDYKQLVPDGKVGDFLDVFRKKFDCDFFVNPETKEVDIRFFPQTVTEPADEDLSGYINGDPTISYPEKFKHVVLKAGKSLEFAETETDTIEQLFSKYKYIDAYDEQQWVQPLFVSNQQILYRKSSGDYWIVTKEVAGGQPKRKRISSGFFDYNKGDSGLTAQEYECKDEQVPMLHVNFTYADGGTPFLDDTLTLGASLPYIGQRRHLNSKIKTSSGELVDEKEQKNNIMICFAVGLSHGPIYPGEWFLGTPLCHDDNGDKWGYFSLEYAGEFGVFQTFWKPRDAILRHSYLPVKANLVLPQKLLLNLAVDRLKLIGGEPLLVNEYGYTIGNGLIEAKELSFYTTRLREPYNLEEEQSVPQRVQQPYFWILETNLSDVSYQLSIIFSDENNMGQYLYYNTLTNPTYPYTLEPPTEQQYNQGGKFYEETYNIEFFIRKRFVPPSGRPWTTIIRLVYPYQGWYIPAKNE